MALPVTKGLIRKCWIPRGGSELLISRVEAEAFLGWPVS